MTTTTQLGRKRGEEYVDLQTLAAELVRRQESKKDFIVDTRRMSFSTVSQGDDGWFAGDPERQSFLTFDSPNLEEQGIQGGPLQRMAHLQIGNRTGIPRAYYQRMYDEAPSLLDDNVGHWFRQNPEPRMVRMLDGNVRAFLSNSYKRRDNFQLMEQAILPVFKDLPELRYHVASLEPNRMYLRAVLPTLEREVKVGDTVQAGVQVRNSEVGDGALEILPFIWRLECLNGMVANVARFRAVHLGKRVAEDDHSFYAEETLQADDHAFFLKARDAIKAALTDVQFQEIVERMQAAAEGREIKNVVAATEELKQTFGLGEKEGESLLTQLASGGDLTQWGAANALTAAAKSVESAQRQYELEEQGWEVLNLNSKEWAKIAVAA